MGEHKLSLNERKVILHQKYNTTTNVTASELTGVKDELVSRIRGNNNVEIGDTVSIKKSVKTENKKKKSKMPWYKRAWNSIKNFFKTPAGKSTAAGGTLAIAGAGIGTFLGGPVGAGVGVLIGITAGLLTSCSDKKAQNDEYKKYNGMKDIFPSDKVKIEPAKVHTVVSGDNIYKIAKEYKVSPERIKKSNPQITDFDKIHIDQKINIPESATIDLTQINNLEDIAEATGISRDYIKDFMENLEVAGIPNILHAYNDNLKKDEKDKEGVWTIGYGHTGKVDGKPITKDTKLDNLKEAYELLAVDLFNAKIEAITYLGDDFLNAPKSVQDGIVDNFFNKGWDPGFTREGSPTTKLQDDLKKRDYTSAASDLLFTTDSKGLKKRVLYRIIYSTRDLKPEQRKAVLDKQKDYYESVIKSFEGDNYAAERMLMQKAWENAYKGNCSNFFN